MWCLDHNINTRKWQFTKKHIADKCINGTYHIESVEWYKVLVPRGHNLWCKYEQMISKVGRTKACCTDKNCGSMLAVILADACSDGVHHVVERGLFTCDLTLGVSARAITFHLYLYTNNLVTRLVLLYFHCPWSVSAARHLMVVLSCIHHHHTEYWRLHILSGFIVSQIQLSRS